MGYTAGNGGEVWTKFSLRERVIVVTMATQMARMHVYAMIPVIMGKIVHTRFMKLDGNVSGNKVVINVILFIQSDKSLDSMSAMAYVYN